MIKAKAFAKLNLGLQIFPHEKIDGFYTSHYINCQLDIYDTLIMESYSDDIIFDCDVLTLSTKDNMVYRVARELKNFFPERSFGAKIILKKKIPIKAGFGGGSSDAASCMIHLLKLWDIQLSKEQMLHMINLFGQDFYYCLSGGLAELQRRGRQFSFKALKSKEFHSWVVILTPTIEKPSTEWVFLQIEKEMIKRHSDELQRLKYNLLNANKNTEIYPYLFNDFEQVLMPLFPVIQEMKVALVHACARKTLLAGAGLSMLGFYDDYSSAYQAFEQLRQSDYFCLLGTTRTVF